MRPRTLDERDQAILNERQNALNQRTEIKSGDFVRFADGTLRQVSHVWKDENEQPEGIQTSTSHGKGDSSFYLGKGYMSFSGGLFTSVPASTFTRSNETLTSGAWFFHHDYACAGGGIQVEVSLPLWLCSEIAPSY